MKRLKENTVWVLIYLFFPVSFPFAKWRDWENHWFDFVLWLIGWFTLGIVVTPFLLVYELYGYCKIKIELLKLRKDDE